MILKHIKIFFQKICKNNFVINTILKTCNSYDIIFIQELFWSFICSIPSSVNKKGEELVGVPNHPNWITFSRNPLHVGDSSRVITYINIRLSSLHFSLWKDIFNHRDISCVSFFNHGLVHLLINIYLDSSQLALKYLKDTEVNIGSVLIMTGDFNIKDSIWDPDFPYHLLHSNILSTVADSLHWELS